MMTSRAEFRLILREDNTADRLMAIGRRLGLIDDGRWAQFEQWQRDLEGARRRLAALSVTGTPAVNDALVRLGSAPLESRRVTLAELMRRPEMDAAAVEQVATAAGHTEGAPAPSVAERVEIELKYDGYLKRQEADAARMSRSDAMAVPDDLDYAVIPGLSREVVEKLQAIRPRSVGQASRISGITPAAVAILMTHIGLSQRRRAEVASKS